MPMNRAFSTNRREFLGAVAAMAVTPALRARRGISPRLQPRRQSLAQLEPDLPALLKQFSVPGVAIAVVENGTLSRAIGAGIKKAGAPDVVAGDTVFEAASLSKGPFAYLVLKLVEEGRISLDAKIGDFFRQPDFVNEPRVDQITPRLVLSHQTGLANWRPAQQPMKLLFDPGTAFGYSGEAYVRLQRYIERTMGASLTTLASTREFVPWKMTRSSYMWRDDFAAIAAEGHDQSGASVRTRLWGYSDTSPQAMRVPAGSEVPPVFAVPNAAASLYSTASDYARFLEQLLAPPAGNDSHLSSSSLDTMFTPLSHPNAELSWGLGWGLASVGDLETFWQWGNNGVYQGFVVAARRTRWGAVVLTNSANGLKLCREIVTRLLGAEHPAFRWNLVIPR